MKYTYKCPCCDRKATKKLHGVYFCETCFKEIKKANGRKKIKGVYGSVLVFSFGQGIPVYRDIYIAFK